MRKFRGLIALVVAMMLCIFMCGCGGDSANNTTGDNANDDIVANKDITGITFVDNEFVYDGSAKNLAISGSLPSGVSVSYTNNAQTEVGEYTVKAVLSGEGYNTLTLTAKLTITTFIDVGLAIATKVVDAFGSVPDAWGFIPESLQAESQTYEGSELDFTSSVSTSSIPTNGIGDQLNVVYTVLNKTETALSYISNVYAVMNTILVAYQEFINDNPDDYTEFTASAGDFSYTISMLGSEYEMDITFPAGIYATITADTEANTYGAQVILTSTTSVKYTVSDEGLTIGLSVLNAVSTMVEFVRDDDTVLGYIYEYAEALGVEVSTSALLVVEEDYTTIVGTKGDFIPTSGGINCEVYDNNTGNFVGSEVKEVVEALLIGDVEYNTYWFNLNDIVGINKVKIDDEGAVYINDISSEMQTTSYGGNDSKIASRRYDIEYKTMYYYTYDEESESYEGVSMEVPMLFIQAEKYDDFTNDFYAENDVSVSVTSSVSDMDAIDYGYETLVSDYEKISDAVSQEDIFDYLGIA